MRLWLAIALAIALSGCGPITLVGAAASAVASGDLAREALP